MVHLPKLNFPKLKIQLFSIENKPYIFCPIRKKKLVLTPEEWVRQNVIAYLFQFKKYPISRISVEKNIHYNSMNKRWDIAVYDNQYEPFLLIECKSTQVKINFDAWSQVNTYQKIFNGNYICITNGLDHLIYFISKEEGSIAKLNDFPEFNFE